MEDFEAKGWPQWTTAGGVFRPQLLQRPGSQLLEVPEPQWNEEPGFQLMEGPWRHTVLGPAQQLLERPWPLGDLESSQCRDLDLILVGGGTWKAAGRDLESRRWSDMYHWCCLCPSPLEHLLCQLICKGLIPYHFQKGKAFFKHVDWLCFRST